ncbi:unnamed protein product [Nezara viridula]|uniref:Ionotropic glutamate receptor C-terminal domain-containing protein n=1 Tax=Nezara viridula TaxID=85310 RepID=A0A9P0H8U7_NEZVI|nr:unnamed protein product [Nezara viridula]
MSVSVAFLLLAGVVRGDEFSSCIQAIAQRYLKSRCLSFQFPLDFREPSLMNVPSLVRSPLLKVLHDDWAVNLPAAHNNLFHTPLMRIGPICYLHCAHIIILDDSVSYIKQINQILYTFYGHFYEDGAGNRTRMVITISAETNEAKIYALLKYMFRMGEIDVIFVGKKDGVISVFTLFPYGKDKKSCPEDNSVEILDRWVGGRFEKNTNLFRDKVPRKFNNCTIEVGTMNDPPHFMLDDDGNGMGGIEYRIVKMIGHHLGLNIRFKIYYSRNDSVFWTEKEMPRGIRADLRKGRVWMIMSGHSNFIFTFSCITVPHSYLTNRVTWFFSNPKQVPNWELIFLTFDGPLWILVLVTTIGFPSIISILAKFFKRKHPFQILSTSMLIMIGLLFANPSSVKLKGALFRIAFAAWLFYIIHINLAYSVALTCFLITGKWESKITSFEQMLQLKIKTAMTENIVIQTSGVEEPLLKKVLSNRIIIQDVSEIFSHHELGNFTLLEREPTFKYKIKKYGLSFYNSDLDLGFVYLGLKMRRNHFLIDRIGDLSSRVLENGSVKKFIWDYWPDPRSPRRSGFESFTLTDLSGPFLVLAVGSTISLIVFLCEILFEYIKSKPMKSIYVYK